MLFRALQSARSKEFRAADAVSITIRDTTVCCKVSRLTTLWSWAYLNTPQAMTQRITFDHSSRSEYTGTYLLPGRVVWARSAEPKADHGDVDSVP